MRLNHGEASAALPNAGGTTDSSHKSHETCSVLGEESAHISITHAMPASPRPRALLCTCANVSSSICFVRRTHRNVRSDVEDEGELPKVRPHDLIAAAEADARVQLLALEPAECRPCRCSSQALACMPMAGLCAVEELTRKGREKRLGPRVMLGERPYVKLGGGGGLLRARFSPTCIKDKQVPSILPREEASKANEA